MLDFNKLIDKHLRREIYPKTIGRYYPSEIGLCMRKIWLSYKNPKETKADLVKIFQMGNMIHDFVVDVLKSEKTPEVELLKTEVPFREKIEDFMISGRVDDIIMIKENGKTVLVEVKSTKMLNMLEKPHPHNEMQLQIYLHFLGIMDGMILYIKKNDLQTKSFNIKYDKAEVEKILERFRILHKHLTENKMPIAESKDTWVCRYCDYREECEKN